ncbi:MAG: glycosyltransferase [Thermoguttaceae bacterium]
MLNGIPVLASNRGSLPETCGDSGFLFNVPEKYTPKSRTPITEEEAAPWVETIVRLWDDEDFYMKVSEQCRCHARRWEPDTLIVEYEKYFNSLLDTTIECLT